MAKINDVLNAVNLLMWDQNVMMPGSAGAATAHAAQTATLKGLAQQMLLSPETERALAESEDAVKFLALDHPRRRAVSAVREAIDFHARVPPKLLAERSAAAGEANQAWITAREQGNFALFEPHLERLMDVNRRYARAVQTERHAHPYDALLELYEPGETVASLRTLFEKLRAGLKPLQAAAAARLSQTRHDFLRREGAFPTGMSDPASSILHVPPGLLGSGGQNPASLPQDLRQLPSI